VAASAGVATFSNLVLTVAGSYTLGASSTGLTGATSTSFQVTAAAADHLAFIQQPTNTTAGQTISPSVTVGFFDVFFNLETGDNTDTVTVGINTGPGSSLGGTLTRTASGGTATFNDLSITKAGTYTLKATSATQASLAQVNSMSFVISPAAINHLGFTQQPTNTIAGATISPSVTVSFFDIFNNLETGDNTDTVTVGINSGPSSTLGGTLTRTASGGTSTFNDLSITTAGTYTLKATSATQPSLAQVNSMSFVISPAAANHLGFTQQPTNTTAGATISPSVTVSFFDIFNNLLTGDNTDTVTVGINTGPSSTLGGTLTRTASGGTATFNDLSITTAGTYTLKATSATQPGLAQVNSNSFVISPAAIDHLAFIQQPTNTTAGATISPSVTVGFFDVFANLETGDNIDTVTVGINSGPSSTLGGTLTRTASGGTATFNDLSITKAGTYTLKATSATQSSLAQVNSNSFVISPAAVDHLAFTQQPTNTTAGATITPSVTVSFFDVFANLETGDNTDTVTVGINSGPSSSLGGTLTRTASGGIATFNDLSITKAGTYTLKATSATQPSLAQVNSNSFVISPAAIDHLGFIQQPTNTTAGATISPSVTVGFFDVFANLETGDNTDTVTVGINSGPSSTVGGTLTRTASGGVATFNDLSITTAGTYTLKATSATQPSLAQVNSSSFIISPAAADHLAFGTQPSNTTAGQTISPAVTLRILDIFGNLTTSTANVSLAIATGPSGSSLLGTTTVAAAGGIATFSTLSIQKAGTYTLGASSTGLTGATSNSFVINPGAASTLSITAPGTVFAGTPFTITVTALDQFGNTATGYTGTIQFTTSAASSTLPANYPFTAGDAGVHTFTNGVTLLASGSQTITATDTVTPSITGTATVSVVAAAGVSNVVVNGADGAVAGGTDSYSIQRSKVNSLVLTFVTTVTIDPGAIQVLKYVGNTPTTAEGLVITTTTVIVGGVPETQATIRFTGSDIIGGSLSDGNYQLRVNYTGIHYTNGNPTPPVNFTYLFWRLFGDALGIRTVNATDQAAIQAAMGSHPGQNNYRWYFDYDVPNNGSPTNTINTLDYYQFQLRYGSTLPPPM
jgi:hypothetical protein